MRSRKGNENTALFSFIPGIRISAIILVLLVLGSCASQKKREELSGFGKLYHNTTAKYNGYFNANEIMIASEAALNEQYVENYNRVLPIYPYVAADNPQQVAPELDEAIKKVSVVVNLHRQSDWTDDCYLLLGKAQYLKQDYESAEHTLKYMTTEFTPEKLAAKEKQKKARKKKEKQAKEKKKTREKSRKESIKKRKKKNKSSSKRKRSKSRKKSIKQQRKERQERAEAEAKEKAAGEEKKTEIATTEKSPKSPEPEISIAPYDPSRDEPNSYFMKHKPAHQEGQLWLARTYIERERFNTAENLLYKLERNPTLFAELQSDVRLAQAHLYMKRKDYPKVIEALESVLDMNMKRSDKARYAFILGQLYQREKQPAKAITAFEKVLELNPEYDMAFRSKLNLVKNSYENGLKSREDAEKELDRMLKDDKNIEYRDQIYFVRAELDLDAGLKAEAIADLSNSLKNNVSNSAQRAESYYLLANLYFEQDEFVKSKLYFDSTLQVMNKIDERYNEVSNYSNNLKEIAEAIQEIELQDSLLAIAQMDAQGRRRLAAQLKAEKDRERERQSKPKTNRFDPGSQVAPSSRTSGGALGGRPVPGNLNSNFFAYNPKSLKKGERDFERKWGEDRILEDNWRRSNKRGGELFKGEDVAPEVALIADDEIEDIFKDVPSNTLEIEEANRKVEEAMFKLGRLFRDRLGNHEKAAEALEELISRYPDTRHLAEAYYYLYLAYTELGEPSKAGKYRDLIAEKFPNTKYAGAILDPDYLDKAREEQSAAEKYYDKTYALFKEGNYEEAAKQLDGAEGKFKEDNYLLPKFALLEALVTGKLEGREAYVASLQDIIAKYPGTEEERRSKEILRVLGEYAGRAGIAEDGSNIDPSQLDKYEFNEKELHYVIVAVKPGQDAKVNEMKASVSNYNRKYHELERLRTSSIYLGADIGKPIIVVRKFNDMNQAMKYYEGIMKNREEYVNQDVEYEVFAITQQNYREVMREKSIENYRAFFSQNYLQ